MHDRNENFVLVREASRAARVSKRWQVGSQSARIERSIPPLADARGSDPLGRWSCHCSQGYQGRSPCLVSVESAPWREAAAWPRRGSPRCLAGRHDEWSRGLPTGRDAGRYRKALPGRDAVTARHLPMTRGAAKLELHATFGGPRHYSFNPAAFRPGGFQPGSFQPSRDN